MLCAHRIFLLNSTLPSLKTWNAAGRVTDFRKTEVCEGVHHSGAVVTQSEIGRVSTMDIARVVTDVL